MDYDFSKEEYRLKAKIISSEYAQKCVDLVNSYDFSQSCKIVLAEIISVNFDPNAVLARNANVMIRLIDLKISLNLAVTAMDVSDTANPGLLNVLQSIETAFGDFVSRSIGGKERDAITKSETVGTTHYTGLSPQQEPQQNRGIKLPWRQ
jgi:hypothetical protein